MKRIGIVVISLAVAACGGGGSKPDPSGNGTTTVAPGPAGPRTVSYITSTNGCVSRHNADSEVSYLLGDKQARYLLWHCANHEQHELRRVRVSLLYDYDKQCYVEDSVVVDFSHCSGTMPPAPNPAVFGVRIVDFSVTVGKNPQGLPGFSYQATLANTGTVPAFEITARVVIDRDVGGNQALLAVIEPGADATTRRYDVFSAAAAGSRFTLDLFVEDANGRSIASKRAVVDVPR